MQSVVIATVVNRLEGLTVLDFTGEMKASFKKAVDSVLTPAQVSFESILATGALRRRVRNLLALNAIDVTYKIELEVQLHPDPTTICPDTNADAHHNDNKFGPRSL